MRWANIIVLVCMLAAYLFVPMSDAKRLLGVVIGWSIPLFCAAYGLRRDASGLSRHVGLWVNLAAGALAVLAVASGSYRHSMAWWPEQWILGFLAALMALAFPSVLASIFKGADEQSNLYSPTAPPVQGRAGGAGQRVEPVFSLPPAAGDDPAASSVGMAGPAVVDAVTAASGGATETAARERRGNYFLRHWRGELSLPVSYWVNQMGIAVLLFGCAFLVEKAVQGASMRWVCGVGAMVLIVALPVWAWSVVGVWRSAMRRSRSGKGRGWAVTAQILVFLGVLSSVGNLKLILLPEIHELGLIALGMDPIGKAEVRLSDDGRAIFISGGLPAGTNEPVLELLKQAPRARMVVLDSYGGRIGEALWIAKEVKARGMDTYVPTHCESACTLIFLAGVNRSAAPGAKLGFHQASLAGIGDGMRRSGMMADSYRAAGLPEAFVRHVIATRADDMWYPTARELRDAGVLTKVSANDEWNEWSFVRSKDEMRAMMNDELLLAYERRFPGTTDRVVELAWAAKQRGESAARISQEARKGYGDVYPVLLRAGDDTGRLHYALWKQRELDAARTLGDEACARVSGIDLGLVAGLPEAIQEERRALALRLFDTPATTPSYSVGEAKSALREVLARLPARYVAALRQPDAARQPALACDAAMALYEALLRAPERQRERALYALVQ